MPHNRTRYIPALDGLRAFAVLSVIAYHMGFTWAQGGLLGVTVFFVLSGYLITGLLIAEYRRTGRINLPDFWLHRVRRLVPAIVFLILTVAALCTLFDHELLTKMRDDILPSLFFYSNWWQIFHNVSYFQAIGSPSPLQHFWSLGIEEQFYLIWPVLLLFLFKRKTRSKNLRRGILIAAALSALAMAILYSPDVDPSRVYYGTDTRAFSLLIGAWLAFMQSRMAARAEKEHPQPVDMDTVFDCAGAVALAGLIAMAACVNGSSPFLYRGGLVLCSVLTAIVIATFIRPESLLGKAAAAKPLVWVGKRSYGMYLWHYPILLLMTNPNSTSDPSLLWSLLELAIIFGVSAFSYRFIEDPIRHGALETWVHGIRSGEIDLRGYFAQRALPAAGAGLVALIAIGGIALVPPEAGIKDIQSLQQAAADQADNQQDGQSEAGADQAATVYSVVLIGDSVSVRAIPDFHETFPDGLIDSAVNRQMTEGEQIYDGYRDAGCVGDTVVFALGTNGPVSTTLIDKLMGDIGDAKQVYFINTRSPRDWVEATNAALAYAAQTYANAHVIDWYGYSAGHDDWFDGDGTHLTADAAEIYTDMIRNAIGYTAPPASTQPPAISEDGDTASDAALADDGQGTPQASTD
jgi:peptidoglycan/LPS O-acetylase OafA/YrhL